MSLATTSAHLSRETALETLSKERDFLRGLGVRRLALFGSAARDEVTPESDVDILVEFSAPVAVVMATLTGIGGGLLRDVLAQRPNLLLSREIYATTLISGGLFYLALLALEGKTLLTSMAGVGFTFAFRALAIYRHWRMPRWLTLRSQLNG